MIKTLLSLTTFCALSTMVTAQNMNFSSPVELQYLYNASSQAVDVNNDGYIDIVTTGLKSISVYEMLVYINDGEGNFTVLTQTETLPGLGFSAMASGDIDDDGDIDLFVLGRNDSSVKVGKLLINDGTGQFSVSNKNFTGLDGGDVEMFDYNNDGRLDIIIAGKNSDNLSETILYKQNSDGTFTDIPATTSGLDNYDNGSSIAYGDIDNDGKIDLVLSGRMNNGSNKTYYYKNTGTAFERQDNITMSQFTEGALEVGDINGDGRLDIIGRSGSFNEVFTYIQQAGGTFTNQNFYINVSSGNGSLGIKDINYDGINDIIAYSNLGVQVFFCSANTTFTEVTLNQPIPGYSRGTFELVDFDGDGLLDFYVDGSNASNGSNKAKLFFNKTCPTGITDLLSISNINGTLTPSAPQIPVAVYRWFECSDYETNISTDYTFTPTVAGEYGLEVSLYENCNGVSDCFQFTLPSDDENGPGVGLSTIESANAFIYPNPSQSGIFNVEADGITAVEVTDINGKVIVSTTDLNTASVVVDLQLQDAGVYFMTVTTAKGRIVERLIK